MSLYTDVFSDPDMGEPVTLHHFDGTVTETRGAAAWLPSTPGDVMASFSESGRMVWTPAPANRSGVSHVTVGGERRRCIDAQEIGVVSDPDVGLSLRCQLQDVVDP